MTIDRPVSEVFEVITQIDDLPEWQESCKAVKRDEDGPVGVGTRWTETRTVMGRTSDQPMEVTMASRTAASPSVRVGPVN